MLFIFSVLFVRVIGIDTYSSYTFISLLPSIPVYDYFIMYLFISCLQTFRLFTVFVIINTQVGTSLVVQWLHPHPSPGGPVWIPDQGDSQWRPRIWPATTETVYKHTKSQISRCTRRHDPFCHTTVMKLPHYSLLFSN